MKIAENTVGKGEIARYKQFLLFPQCFQKACFPGASKGVIVWVWVNIHNFSKPSNYKLFFFCQNHISLNLSQTTHFRLFQTERACRQQFQI